MPVAVGDAILVGTGFAAFTTAVLTYLNTRRTKQVHEEIQVPSADSTGEAIAGIAVQLDDVESEVANVQQDIHHLGAQVEDLSVIVTTHLSDGHGPKRPMRRRRD